MVHTSLLNEGNGRDEHSSACKSDHNPVVRVLLESVIENVEAVRKVLLLQLPVLLGPGNRVRDPCGDRHAGSLLQEKQQSDGPQDDEKHQHQVDQDTPLPTTSHETAASQPCDRAPHPLVFRIATNDAGVAGHHTFWSNFNAVQVSAKTALWGASSGWERDWGTVTQCQRQERK